MKRRLPILSALPVPFALAVLACLLIVPDSLSVSAADSLPLSFRFRMLVSEGMIGADINEKDANLAMQAWKDTLVKQTGFLIDVHVSGFAKALREIREHQVDGFSLTTVEFLQAENYAAPNIVVDESDASGGIEYLLLVLDDSAIKSLADLHRKSLNVLDTTRMSLATMWLETVFASANLGKPQDVFSRITPANKLSSVVLPVYFRQADACLVTRRGFNTMCELNPQLGRKLRILAKSPKLVTTLMGFHKECRPEYRQIYQSALIGLNKTVAGQQALTLFESSRLLTTDISLLRSARELVKEYDRIHLKAAVRK